MNREPSENWKKDSRKRWGRFLRQIGKPFRSGTGHVYFRQEHGTIRRLSHKHTGPAAFEKLTKRQQIRTVRREMFANSVA